MKPSVLVCTLAAIFIAPSALASHAWGNYHWARTTQTFDLTIVNSTTTDWDPYVTAAMEEWSVPLVLKMVPEDGKTSSRTRRQCNAPNGKVRVCNLAYGQNGWLGIAGISVDTNGHIIKGYTKLNDSYFSSSYYNKPEWKQAVTCQEIGHNIGLGHQDENFNNAPLLSCMDYQDPPWEYPNWHDYDELASIYDHLDGYNSYAGTPTDGGGGSGGCTAPPGKGCNKSRPQSNRDIGWGVSLGRRGNHETFIRVDPDGTRHLTHVIWVEGH